MKKQIITNLAVALSLTLLACQSGEQTPNANQPPQKQDTKNNNIQVLDTISSTKETDSNELIGDEKAGEAIAPSKTVQESSDDVANELSQAAPSIAPSTDESNNSDVENKPVAYTNTLPVNVEKKGPNHFIVTMVTKNSSHPAFNQGHTLGFAVDKVQGKTLVLRRGETYKFEIFSDPKHDVYFTTSDVGWGGGVITEGIEGQFTYSGTIKVNFSSNTPDTIYYQCYNHNSMGGKIHIVNKNTSDATIKTLLGSNDTPKFQQPKNRQNTNVSKSQVEQKISYTEKLLAGELVKRIEASSSSEAKKLIAKARNKLKTAQRHLTKGNLGGAMNSATESMKLVFSASSKAPKKRSTEIDKDIYEDLLNAVHNYQISHQESYKRLKKKSGTDGLVDYDKNKVDKLVADAKKLADKKQYDKANEKLTKAERLVTTAMKEMLDSKTIVYDLNFETAKEEYEYEIKRFKGYMELIPVAIKEKKPSAGSIKLMDSFVEKGNFQKSEANEKANGGDYPTAIAMMHSATKQIRRALRIAGVSQ